MVGREDKWGGEGGRVSGGGRVLGMEGEGGW